MQVIEHKKSGKVHIPPENGKGLVLCGSRMIQDCQEMATFRDSQWLDDFPEDYGDSQKDCEKCAKITDFNE
ncbi:hypothetical protein [His 1 virus]|uniref:Uncharacterized protein ORF35 n=1 Tax=His1 virus (isolate Australia/Victoria) TaxID=654912 RepID=Y035_HIS1I|nr:hypothetical protein His1V_gp35 [His 1 virus]Q25BG0.1 RecName: Full=Uncharacterized protein ORF35 [His1 virus (isolate Victoria)]AAQ13762.1 hypothetical protein [His 1 virus]